MLRFHALSFSERRDNAERRRDNAERRRDKSETDFWTKADPEIDAWMLVTGRTREVFDINAFAKMYEKHYPRADGAKRRARVLIPPGYLHPGKRKH
jgi:hypothetical protein